MQFVKSNIDDPSNAHSTGCNTESSRVHLVAGIPTGQTFHLHVAMAWKGIEAFERTYSVRLHLTVMLCHFLVGQCIALLKMIARYCQCKMTWEATEKLNPKSGIVSSVSRRTAAWTSSSIGSLEVHGHCPAKARSPKKIHQQQVQQVRQTSWSVCFQMKSMNLAQCLFWRSFKVNPKIEILLILNPMVGLVPPKSVELFAVRLPFWSKPCDVPA